LTAGCGLGSPPPTAPPAPETSETNHAETYTAFGAVHVCSCVHISGRSLESCEQDFTTDMTGISFSLEGDVVRASALDGQISAEARFTPELGCALVAP
jgi:hypothetical protein